MNIARPSAFSVEGLEGRYLLALFGPDVSFGIGGTVEVPGHYVIAALSGGRS